MKTRYKMTAMTKNTLLASICLSLLLSSLTHTATAGQVYRFKDHNGIKTMSKALPPYAAQKGYDILDESSMRVIETVPPALTPDEIEQYNKQQESQKEQKRLAALEAKKEQERQRQARLYDANLRASYRTEDELHKKRETELLYFQNQIEKINGYLKRNKEKLHQFQQQAAQIELSGRTVVGNLKKRLIAAEQEIKNNQQELERLSVENKTRIEQYDKDLIRLKELMAKDGASQANVDIN